MSTTISHTMYCWVCRIMRRHSLASFGWVCLTCGTRKRGP